MTISDSCDWDKKNTFVSDASPFTLQRDQEMLSKIYVSKIVSLTFLRGKNDFLKLSQNLARERYRI